MKALITGASSGIGRDMAIILSNMGYDLILVARSENKLNELKKELKTNVKVIPMDISSVDNCKELYEKIYVHDKKSIGVKSLEEFEYIVVNGKKKRTYYDYNLTELLNKFSEEMQWEN